MLETMLTSPEVSKELQEAGFDEETCFYYILRYKNSTEGQYSARPEYFKKGEYVSDAWLPAWTLEQIWHKLPKGIESGFVTYYLKITNAGTVCYEQNHIMLPHDGFGYERNLATQAGSYWLYLKKEGYIK